MYLFIYKYNMVVKTKQKMLNYNPENKTLNFDLITQNFILFSCFWVIFLEFSFRKSTFEILYDIKNI